MSGEEASYTYDSLQHLIATTTDPSWGQSFSYDGFGNRTAAMVTKGSAPSSSMVYDPATNRIGGGIYDASGNMLVGSYDLEKRLINYASFSEFYGYAPDNRRIWKQMLNGKQALYYFYGISGQKLGTYSLTYCSFPDSFAITSLDVNVYFGSKTIVSRGVTPLLDRLGSNRAGGSKYFPYGEEQQVTAGDRDKVGTYYRDQTTGLDYAQNRYYANTLGRFLSPDPYQRSVMTAKPLSWNRYVYTENDPVNNNDPTGLQSEGGQSLGCFAYGLWWPVSFCDNPLASQAQATNWQKSQGVIGLIQDFIGGKQFGATCENDLKAVGTNAAGLQDAAQQVQFVNGTASSDLVSNLGVGAFAQAGASRQTAADAQHGVTGWMIGQEFAFSTGTAAMTQLGATLPNTNVYISTAVFSNPNFLARDIATIMHELLHALTGFTDDTLKEKLGLHPDGTSGSDGSWDISAKLLADCVVGK